MGGGSRANHQHHSVDPGASTATPEAPATAPVEHIALPAGHSLTHLAYQPAGGGAAEGTLEVSFRVGDTIRFGGVERQTWTTLQSAAGHGAAIERLMTLGVFASRPRTHIDPADSWYARQHDAERRGQNTAAQDRCPRCGQFLGQPAHHCPVTDGQVPAQTYVTDHGSLQAPALSRLRQLITLSDQAVLVPIEARFADPVTGNYGSVTGEVAVYRGDLEPLPTEPSEGLRCSCGRPHCSHVQLAAAEITDRLHSPSTLNPQRRATTAVLTDLGVGHAATRAAQQHARAHWPPLEVSYVDDVGAFQDSYRAALRRAGQGQEVVPLMTQDATGGLGARDGGRGFGVELEFDLPVMDHEQYTATREAIARDLAEAGLAADDYIWGYHENRRDGYSDARDGWRMENDGTVDGEIVSPILYDTPQTWEDLDTVCAIIRHHGGHSSINTGGHVHVSAGNYDHIAGNHSRLIRLVHSYSDTLFRLATNPDRGRHRGIEWCEPNYVPAGGYQSLTAARSYNSGHSLALNLHGMQGRASDHVEFRMWDGCLDPGIIQTHVKLSLGLTEAAFRTAGATGHQHEGLLDQLGSHYRRFGGRGRGVRLRAEEWRDSTRSFRSLVDTIFHRATDKAQATSLFAVTRWANL